MPQLLSSVNVACYEDTCISIISLFFWFQGFELNNSFLSDTVTGFSLDKCAVITRKSKD